MQERYIVTYYTKGELEEYGDKALVRQIIDTNDIDSAIPQFLHIVAMIRSEPVSHFVVHKVEVVVRLEEVPYPDTSSVKIASEPLTLTLEEIAALIFLFDGQGGPNTPNQSTALEKLEKAAQAELHIGLERRGTL